MPTRSPRRHRFLTELTHDISRPASLSRRRRREAVGRPTALARGSVRKRGALRDAARSAVCPSTEPRCKPGHRSAARDSRAHPHKGIGQAGWRGSARRTRSERRGELDSPRSRAQALKRRVIGRAPNTMPRRLLRHIRRLPERHTPTVGEPPCKACTALPSWRARSPASPSPFSSWTVLRPGA